MARYISNEILCEAYTRLNTNLYNTEIARNQLKRQILPFFEERAKFLLGEEIRVEVIFERGSLITKLQVYGVAGAIMINGYGDFRESITQLIRDVTQLTEAANLEVIFRTKTPYCDRIRIEKRKGVFGRVDELLVRLDKIQSDISSTTLPATPKAVSDTIKKIDAVLDWHHKTADLFLKLDSPETVACVAEGLLAEIKKTPLQFGWTPSLASSGIRGASIRSDPSLLGKLQGANTQLQTTLDFIKKDLKDRETLAKHDIIN